MTTKNNEELLVEETNIENTEDTKKNKWHDFKEASKERYAEIVTDLKNPIKQAVMKKNVSNKLVAILRGFLFLGLSFVILFPIFEQFTVSIRFPTDLYNKTVIYIPENYSIFSYKLSIVLLDYWKGLWCNLKVSTISTVCQLFATSLAGYALSRLKFRGSNLIFWVIMMTLIVPPQAVSLARRFYLVDFDILSFGDNPGLFEALFGQSLKLTGEGKDIVFYVTSLTGQGIRAALFIFLFKQFFRGIPIELEESAQIDGAGVFRTFWSIMLPNARGVIITVALFAFVWQWNDVYYTGMYEISGRSFPMLTRKLITISEQLPATINRKEYKEFIAIVGENISKDSQFQNQIMMTAALLMMSPLLIGYLFVQRLFIEGVERSGIVG